MMKMLIINGLRFRTFFSAKSGDGRANLSRHSLRRKKLVLVFLSALLLIMAGLFESCDFFKFSQEWVLVNQAGDSATVTAPAGTCKSIFTETTDSTGWYAYIPGLDPIRLTVGGSISGDNWRFVDLTGSGPQVTVIGDGSGTADSSFPNSNSVSGTVTINTQSPLGATSSTGSWSGTRTK
jgi:hypothetical protein